MKILYFAEYNIGGGPKANLNLADSSCAFADVSFLGIDHVYPEYKNIHFLKTDARKPISIKYYLDFRKALKKVCPDIVHAPGMFTALLSILARSLRRKKFRVIMTLHHTHSRFRFNFVAKRLVGLLNKVDMVHYLTEYQKNTYIRYGLNPLNFRIIPNISYIQSYSEDEVNELRSDLIARTLADWLLVFIGRIDETKQLHMFIETVKKINLQGMRAAGVIVGSGAQAYIEKLKDQTDKLEITSKIIFTGFSKQPELYIRACDISLFPTMHEEALPLFILESFSQKRTMVVSGHPSIRSIVTDRIDSLVAGEHTAEAYAEKCLEIIESPRLRKQLETGAGYTYEKYYTPGQAKKKFYEMYLEIMNK
jgi:glycosyltransferase involved in cell wall biosynthesis